HAMVDAFGSCCVQVNIGSSSAVKTKKKMQCIWSSTGKYRRVDINVMHRPVNLTQAIRQLIYPVIIKIKTRLYALRLSDISGYLDKGRLDYFCAHPLYRRGQRWPMRKLKLYI